MKIAVGLLSISLVTLAFSCVRPQPTQGDEISSERVDLLNSVLAYIKQNHSDATPFIKENTLWAKGDTEIKAGYTRNTYLGNGWNLTVGRAGVPRPAYEIKAQYGNSIMWIGTVADGRITEDTYSRQWPAQ